MASLVPQGEFCRCLNHGAATSNNWFVQYLLPTSFCLQPVTTPIRRREQTCPIVLCACSDLQDYVRLHLVQTQVSRAAALHVLMSQAKHLSHRRAKLSLSALRSGTAVHLALAVALLAQTQPAHSRRKKHGRLLPSKAPSKQRHALPYLPSCHLLATLQVAASLSMFCRVEMRHLLCATLLVS